MKKLFGLLFVVLLLPSCAGAGEERLQVSDTAPELPKPAASEVSFCSWWQGWWRFPDENSFGWSDEELSQAAFDRSLEIVKKQPLTSEIGIDWFSLTDRYGKAMLALGERAYIRSESGWGTVLDQVADSYAPINDACGDVAVQDRLSGE